MKKFDESLKHVALLAFVPFGSFLVYVYYQSMPLRWVSLASLLESVSLLSIYVNFTVNDILWTTLGVWAFFTVCIPLYMSAVRARTPMGVEKHYGKIRFAGLFKTCANGVFSDYKISLLAKIPLVMQVLAGGSMLYGIFGADWIMHALAGFGIGAMALKAYKKAVNSYGYSRLASYFRLDRFNVFRVERETGSAEFTLFSLITVGLLWELFERLVYLVSPMNVFRIRAEPLWNVVGDMAFVLIGGIMAWYLINCKLRWV